MAYVFCLDHSCLLLQEPWYNELPDVGYNDEGEFIELCKMGQQTKYCRGGMAVVDGNHRSDTSKSHCLLTVSLLPTQQPAYSLHSGH